MIANCMCQFDWVMGCPDIWSSIILECVYEGASE